MGKVKKPDKTKLTANEEHKLIKFVKSHEALWKTDSKQFANKKLRDSLWRQIAGLLNREVDMLKKRWKTFRDYECKKEKKVLKTGSARPDDYNSTECDDDIDMLLEQDPNCLSFLRSVPFNRETKSNVANKTNVTVNPLDTHGVEDEMFSEDDDENRASTSQNNDAPIPKQKKPSKSKKVDPVTEQLLQIKRERTELIKQLIEKGGNENASRNDPITKQCDVFATSLLALPSHLQKMCKREIQAIIYKYEDMYENEKKQKQHENDTDPHRNESV